LIDFALPDDNWDLESNSDMSSMGEEDGEDVDESKRGKIDEKLQKYMKQMDQELSGTTIGQSFEKKTSEVCLCLI
jgi:SGT1 protein